ncbi:MAG: hypothetical protein AB7O45_15235 [Alphaproteobacteria bacterium]
MPTFIASVVVAIAIAVGAVFVLDGFQQRASTAYTGAGVRMEPNG